MVIKFDAGMVGDGFSGWGAGGRRLLRDLVMCGWGVFWAWCSGGRRGSGGAFGRCV